MYTVVRSRAVRRWRQHQKNVLRRVMRDGSDPLAMDAIAFHKQYRVTKELFTYLCELLEEEMRITQRCTSIPTALKILSALSFLGTGSYQTIVGQDWLMPLSQPSISRCLDEVVEALQKLLHHFVKFPTTQEERNRVKVRFYEKFGIPGVLGCIDGTLVAIAAPASHPSEAAFFGRKGFHAINAGIVCDSDLKIIGVCAKYGGSAHDSYVWRSWPLSDYVETIYNSGEAGWLLGDSGYPQRPWLMTPILNAAEGSPEAYYTERHVRTRVCVERCIGLLKARWRCLLRHRVLHYKPPKCAKIINACTVLHNLCLNDNLDVNFEEIDEDPMEMEPFSGSIPTSATSARQQLVETLWQNHFNNPNIN